MVRLPSFTVLAVALAMAACDSKPASRQASQELPRGDVRDSRQMAGGGGSSMKQRQADFLNRIRSSDPQGRTIDRAVINDQNELGLILDRSVQLDDIPKLMKGMLTQMAREFPGEDLTVIAYTPSNPPRKIGTGRLDARSREMSYTPEA
jgi:hypothetical protein